jgi:carbon starvation protein
MNGLTIVGAAIVILIAAYAGYGHWLVKTWGIDPKAKTPAYRFEDGQDYTPASKFTVFAHQFSSITGAGPVTGPIIAAMFGWLPALLWLLLGSIFFGAVQDFLALYASVKNDGKSMGVIMEKYVGKTGRRLFLLFSWLFTLLVIAAFADIVANTFNGFGKDGTMVVPNAAAASISMLYIVVAVFFGIFLKKVKPSAKLQFGVAILLIIGMLGVGIAYPLYFDRTVWLYVVFAYMFAAAVMPMWLLMQPRDYLSVFLLLGMVAGAVVGVLLANPTINMPAFVGFEVGGKQLFPILFITIACGAVSGFHSLVSSGTSSKTVSNEKDMLCVGYGSMLIESLLGVVALVIVCSAAKDGALPAGTPFQIFSGAVGGFFAMFGLPRDVAACIMTMCVSALALTTLDSVARIGRMSFQELCMSDGEVSGNMSAWQKVCTNRYFATVITLLGGYLLCLGGYMNIWPLFGAANQLLCALVLIALAVFLKVTGRKGWMLYVPVFVMFAVTLTALVQAVYGIYGKLVNGGFVFMVDGLQLILAIMLLVLGLSVAFHCGKELVTDSPEEKKPEFN